MRTRSSHHVRAASIEKLGATNVDGDRIINLPDDIISHILSHLPTKDAVRTRVLSQQWNKIFTFIQEIDTTCKSLGGQDRISSLHRFVNKLLEHRGDDSRTRTISFRLVLFNKIHHPSLLTGGWIHKILCRKVQNLVIDAYSIRKVYLKRCLRADCPSLTTLNISLNCIIRFPDEKCFPNLKSLCLNAYTSKEVRILNELLTFPALEVLEMRYCMFLNVKFVEINVPQLVTFKYEHNRYQQGYKLQICGPKLSEFYYSYGDLHEIVLYAPELHYAALDLDRYWESKVLASRASALLKGSPSLKCLKLSCNVAEALAQWRGVHVIPAFYQLKRLEIRCHSEELLDLLRVMPCLDSLNLWILDWPSYRREPLPLCFPPHLKEVEFIYFHGGIRQMDLTKLFVENVSSLERVIVYLVESPRVTENEIRDQLETLKPVSSSCVIVVK